MISYLIRRTIYGLSVLWGAITLVFIIFNLKPGDASQMLLGQRATPEAIAAVNKDLGLDLPGFQRYLLYLNDLSPVSIHSEEEEDRVYFDQEKYSGFCVVSAGAKGLYFKSPYLRKSYRTKRDVSAIIGDALPGTFILASLSMLFALVIGLIVGIISALKKDSLFDRSALIIAVLGMSAPSFYMAIIFSWIGGYLLYSVIPLPIFPLVLWIMILLSWVIHSSIKSGFTWKGMGRQVVKAFLWASAAWLVLLILNSFLGHFIPMDWLKAYISLPGTYLEQSGSLYEVDVFDGPYLAPRNIILPTLTLGIRPLAIIIQLMRNALLEELGKDYIRTAKAKGLSTYKIVMKHAFRNALNPVVTAVSGWFASLLAGAVFIEFIFGWQGLGLQVYEALVNEDFPLVIGSVIVISSIFVMINILVDILYGVIDPRVRMN
jgi:ABC-type dipeptide/oligopeptide/nickel transport system permease component